MIRYARQAGILLLCFSFSWTLAQDDPMQQGITAFNNENFGQALTLFREAQNRGTDSPSLDYNIAVTLYRLGRYDEAKTLFQTLPQTPRWTPLVRYNLGLIAEAEGNPEAALDHYRQARDQDGEAKISAAATRKIAALETSDRDDQPQDRTPPVSLVSLTVGSDSNAASLSDEFVQSTSQQEDLYSEFLGYTQHYLLGRRRNGLKAYGLLFSRKFDDFDHLDSLVAGGGLAWEQPLFGYDTESELRVTQTRLDGDKVADQVRLKLGAAHDVEFGRLATEYYYSYFSAGDRYEQVQGSQHRVDISWRKQVSPLTLSLRYRFEANNRDDLSRANGAFSSYSPDRNQFLGAVDWRISDKWSTGISYEYIDDTYDGTNVLRDTDGQVKQQGRERTIDRFRLDLDYRLSPKWLLRARAEHADVDDVFDLYTYDKQRVSGSVEYRFQ